MITGFGNLLMYAVVFIGPRALTVHKLMTTMVMLRTMRAAPAQFYLLQLRVVTYSMRFYLQDPLLIANG